MAAPVIATGTELARLIGAGEGAADFTSAYRAAVRLLATEDHNSAANGSEIILSTTKTGGIITRDWLRLTNDGRVHIGSDLGPVIGVGEALRLVREASAASESTGFTLEHYRNGQTNTNANILGRTAFNTAASPRRIQAETVLMRIAGTGYQAVDDTTLATVIGTARYALDGISAEAFTSTGQGTRIQEQTTPLGATAMSIRRIVGAMKVLTNNTAISVLAATCAAGSIASGTLRYAIEVTNGTDYQAEVGQANYTVVNKAGTFTVLITEVNSQQSLSSGTLATTWSISGANPAVISINANSSLTPSAGYPRILFTVENLGVQLIAVT